MDESTTTPEAATFQLRPVRKQDEARMLAIACHLYQATRLCLEANRLQDLIPLNEEFDILEGQAAHLFRQPMVLLDEVTVEGVKATQITVPHVLCESAPSAVVDSPEISTHRV